jgi:hypothetical protein
LHRTALRITIQRALHGHCFPNGIVGLPDKRFFPDCRKRGANADVARNRSGAVKAGRISKFSDQAGGGQGRDPIDGHQQLANLMIVELVLDVTGEVLQPPTQHLQILTEVLNP